MDVLLSLRDAANLMNISEEGIVQLIHEGEIKAATAENGTIMVYLTSLPLSKTERPEYKRHAHLQGQAIWIKEASRKYEIPHPTISRWVKSGIIAKVGTFGNHLLIDAADMAYCAEIYRQRGGSKGVHLFNPDGTPYIPKPKR